MYVNGLGGIGNAQSCPAGYYPKIYTTGTGGATVQCAPRNEEDLWCSWFGIGCQGPPPLPPPQAPQTPGQMTIPGEWTPAMATPDLEQWKADYLAYTQSNPGQAAIPVAANQAGQSVLDFASNRGVWILVGAAVVIGLIVMAKRV